MKNLNYLLKIGIIYFLLIYIFISFTTKEFNKNCGDNSFKYNIFNYLK